MKVIRVLRSTALAVGLAGCSQPPAAGPKGEAPATPAVVLAPSASAAEPNPQPPAPAKPEPPPPTFAFAADQTGAALARVVAPDVARPLPAERFGDAPKARAVPARVLEPEATAPANYVPPPVLLPKPAAPKPAAPAEKLPLDLGARADALPARIALPVAPVVTERARDVNRPPAAPVLGRPLLDRVGLDDPTGDLANAVVVGGAVKVPPTPSPFVRVAIPDPFEFAGQVRPKVPATAEPSAAPVAVNPQRAK